MARCVCCNSILNSPAHSGAMINYIPRLGAWCDYCKMMVPCITGQRPSEISTKEDIVRARRFLGNPGTRPSQIWNRIRDCEGLDADWCMDGSSTRQEWITDQPPDWMLLEEDLEYLSNPEVRAPLEQRRRLQIGGVLPDGSHLSWSSGTFSLDGVKIAVPFRGLNKILNSKLDLSGIEWKKMLFSISLSVKRFNGFEAGPLTEKSSLIHPVHLMLFGSMASSSPWAAMMNRRSGRMHDIPKDAVRDTEWMRRWDAWVDENRELARPSERDSVTVPHSLFISKAGRLQLRVRRDHGWRKLEVGSHPMTWAKVVTWALSPPDHPQRHLLTCIQQSVFADPESPMVGSDEKRGIELLKNVVESSERAEIVPNMKSIKVTGTSGLSYFVTPGNGGHGTRFSVWPKTTYTDSDHSRREDLNIVRGRGSAPPICIVERPELKRLVVGDAVASVVMALLDDMSSKRNIDTLRNHISRRLKEDEERLNPEIAQMNQARWYRRRLENNGVADRVRRYTESFPQLWGALLRLPLGERMAFRAMRGNEPNITFDGCQTQFRTRNMVERRAVYRMLEDSGWVRDRIEEDVRGEQRSYIRTGTGERDLGEVVREIAQLLEPQLMVDDRIRLIQRQLWTYFERENPGPGALLPGMDEEIA